VAANNQPLVGGDREVDLQVRFSATDIDTEEKQILVVQTSLYEADIDEDVILSYLSMVERDIKIGPRNHGFWVDVGKQKFWVPGFAVTQNSAPMRGCPENRFMLTGFRPQVLKVSGRGPWTCFVAGKVQQRCWRDGVLKSTPWITIRRGTPQFVQTCLSGTIEPNTPWVFPGGGGQPPPARSTVQR
jgi:hypothetical protein